MIERNDLQGKGDRRTRWTNRVRTSLDKFRITKSNLMECTMALLKENIKRLILWGISKEL